MFPIIPSHLLCHMAPVSRSPLASDHQMWSAWTESVLNGNNFGRQRQEARLHSPTTVECAGSESEEGESDRQGGGCSASALLPKGSQSRAIENFEMYAPAGIAAEKHVRIRPNPLGVLQAEDGVADHQWIKSMRLAADTYSNNAVVEVVNSKQVRVRITKNIQPGEEIQLWFSEEILALMYIPFLTPANIRGKNCYTCHVCDKSYESPNPLKIHLATNCNRYTQNELWMRLDQSPSRQHYIYHPPYMLPEWTMLQQRLHLHGTPPPPPSPAVETSPKPRLSAFQPVHAPLAHFPLPPVERSADASSEKVVAHAAAHLETIVSNMGTSKQGHLCIYCGKLYSRKYGLKIHIRTHTGFKPLKCKYCFRPFGDPSNLNKHVRLHVQSNTLYKCNICEKILVRRRDLQRHMQTRHHQMNVEEDAVMEGSSSSTSNDGSSSSEDEETKIKCKVDSEAKV